MTSLRTPYEVLGIDPTLEEAPIKKAFRAKVRATHPDNHHGDSHSDEKLRIIIEAWKALKDPIARKAEYEHAIRINVRSSIARDFTVPINVNDALYKLGKGLSREFRNLAGKGYHTTSLDFILKSYKDAKRNWGQNDDPPRFDKDM